MLKTTPNTISIGTRIHSPKIMEAKTYLKQNFENKYDIAPHLNFLIMAMPDFQLKNLERTLDKYFGTKRQLQLKFGYLHYEEKKSFFSIPIVNDAAMAFHKELLELLNPIRVNYIREKDEQRIAQGKTDELEEKYIYDYGYLRVLEKFQPHITIGNINTESFDIDEVKTKLDSILRDFYNSTLSVVEIYATFIEDADVQSEYKWLWEKNYILK